jgi:hypothetical protein
VKDDTGFRHAVFQQHRELLRRHRLAEIITLRLITSVSAKKRQFLQSFDALRNDPQLETPGHADHRFHDGCIVTSIADLTDKRLIDFDGVDRKLSKIAQARIARPEVVDRHSYPTFSQCLEDDCSKRSRRCLW